MIDAFAALYARHRDRVHRFVHAMLSDCPSDVDDVAALAKIVTIRQPDRFEAWLNGVLRLTVLNHRSRRARQRERELREDSPGVGAMARSP